MSDRLPSESEKKLAEELGVPYQEPPKSNDNKSAHDLVIEDMAARKQFGLKKYGTLLQPGNGRDALQDAYEEALDLCVYLRTKIEEDKMGLS